MSSWCTWDDLKGSILFQWVIKSEPHRENRATSNTPVPVNTQQLHLHNTNDTKKNLSVFFHTLNSLPHILMPGHIWKSILSRAAISFAFSLLILLGAAGFECWVFADEAGVQQDDVRAQDGSDHVQDLRVFGESHHPRILKVNIVETVLGVLLTWKQTQICNTPIHWQIVWHLIMLISGCVELHYS